jgi:hypothetical protein
MVFHELDASVGASGPHDFAVRISAIRQRRIRVHRIPPHVRDDRETPLLRGGTGQVGKGDLPVGESEKFFAEGLDTKIARQPAGQITASCLGSPLTKACQRS